MTRYAGIQVQVKLTCEDCKLTYEGWTSVELTDKRRVQVDVEELFMTTRWSSRRDESADCLTLLCPKCTKEAEKRRVMDLNYRGYRS